MSHHHRRERRQVPLKSLIKDSMAGDQALDAGDGSLGRV
jgi:hypothetical protein